MHLIYLFQKYFLYCEDSKKCLKLTKIDFFLSVNGGWFVRKNLLKNPFKCCLHFTVYMYFFNKIFLNNNEMVKISMVR